MFQTQSGAIHRAVLAIGPKGVDKIAAYMTHGEIIMLYNTCTW